MLYDAGGMGPPRFAAEAISAVLWDRGIHRLDAVVLLGSCDKIVPAMLMAAAVLLPVFLPWLDRSRVKSIRYRGWIYKFALSGFVVSFLLLGWLGTMPAEGAYVMAARIFTVVYFAFFLLMPYYTAIDKTKPVPDRVVYHG